MKLLRETRIPSAHLSAICSTAARFERTRRALSDALLSVRRVVEDYKPPRNGTDGTAAEYKRRWGLPNLTAAELRQRFLEDFPHASDDPFVTGAFFPGLVRCRPSAFVWTELAALGTCAKTYQEAHTHYSPGTFPVCCGCAHPKMSGFVVLDKREGPPALLNTIFSYFPPLPHLSWCTTLSVALCVPRWVR